MDKDLPTTPEAPGNTPGHSSGRGLIPTDAPDRPAGGNAAGTRRSPGNGTARALARSWAILLTCEHAGQRVPPQYANLFKRHRSLLQTHRGYDIGAYSLAKAMAAVLDVPLLAHDVTRLLIDVNRSPNRSDTFSEVSAHLSPEHKNELLQRYHQPYRHEVHQRIEQTLRQTRTVIHISVHSFTPMLNGERRDMDLGLLYDPQRTAEKLFCRHWRQQIRKRDRDIVIRYNAPYRGIADGLTTTMRGIFKPQHYLGLELEVNQSLLARPQQINRMAGLVAEGLLKVEP